MYQHNTIVTNDGTATKIDSPNGHVAPHAETTSAPYDSHVNTREESKLWQQRMTRLEQEANDPTNGPGARSVAQHQLNAMKKATAGQIAAWKALDAQRAKQGGR